ncbi:MAG: lamin tail domain-containing protein [bacterium]|nr:lamin tail domain-containing protein [bacterium]
MINEWLPNPAGTDAKGEWIELFNDGSAAANLTGWHVATKTGKAVALKGTIQPGEFLVLKRGDFTFSLRNTDEALSLYGADGKLVDQSALVGTAMDGKSFSRVSHGSNVKGQLFAWSDPTPGAHNATAPALALINENPPLGISLVSPRGTMGFFQMMTGVALALAVAAVIIKIHFKNHEA